jgi:hypothetical protein
MGQENGNGRSGVCELSEVERARMHQLDAEMKNLKMQLANNVLQSDALKENRARIRHAIGMKQQEFVAAVQGVARAHNLEPDGNHVHFDDQTMTLTVTPQAPSN